MSSELPETSAFLDLLGGHIAVAARLGLEPNVVWNWRKRGIAGKYRAPVAQLASERGVNLPDNFFPQLRPESADAAE